MNKETITMKHYFAISQKSINLTHTTLCRFVAAACLSLFVACGQDPLPQIDPEKPLLPIQELTIEDQTVGQEDGHWDKTKRAVTIDEQDIITLNSAKAKIEEAFGALVINVPLIDKRTGEDCLTGMRASDASPEKTVPRIIDQIAAKNLSFDKIIVQVDLMSPDRTLLYHQCLEESGSSRPNFYLEELRRETLSAFEGLARLTEIDSVVIGLELNTYEHFDSTMGVNYTWDYINFIDMYREIYSKMKTLNQDLKIGPSFGWSTFQLKTIPKLAEEFKLDTANAEENLILHELALRQSIWPFIASEDGVSADFVGVSLIPDNASPPYLGSPAPEDENAVLQFYKNIPLLSHHPELSSPLPLAFTMLDWITINNANGGQKVQYVQSLKKALSNIDPQWVAWRRLSNIPEDPPETSPCRTVMNQGHDIDFCYAGLLDYNGQTRNIWDEFTINP